MAVEFVACLSVYEQLEETTAVANEIYIVEWKNKNNFKKKEQKKERFRHHIPLPPWHD